MKKKNIIASAMLALTIVFGMAGGMTVTPQLAEPVQAARRCNHNWRAIGSRRLYYSNSRYTCYRQAIQCSKCDASKFRYSYRYH